MAEKLTSDGIDILDARWSIQQFEFTRKGANSHNDKSNYILNDKTSHYVSFVGEMD